MNQSFHRLFCWVGLGLDAFLLTSLMSHFPPSSPTALISFPLSLSIPTDVLDGVEGHSEENAIDSERGEDEEEGRAENDDTDEATNAAASPSMLVTNPLSLEASVPATSSTQGTSGLTNTGFELASLGKVASQLCMFV